MSLFKNTPLETATIAARENKISSQKPGEREEAFIGRVKKEMTTQLCEYASNFRSSLLAKLDERMK